MLIPLRNPGEENELKIAGQGCCLGKVFADRKNWFGIGHLIESYVSSLSRIKIQADFNRGFASINNETCTPLIKSTIASTI